MAERSWGCQAPEPAPTPPTPLLEEGHNDTLSLQEGVRGKRLLWDRSFDREMYLLAGCRLPWHRLATMQTKQKSISSGLQNSVLTITLQIISLTPHPNTVNVFVKRQCEINRERRKQGNFTGPPSANPFQDLNEEIIFL